MKTIKMGQPFRVEGEDRLAMFVRSTGSTEAKLMRYTSFRGWRGRSEKRARKG